MSSKDNTLDFGISKMAAVAMETTKISKISKCSKIEETLQQC